MRHALKLTSLTFILAAAGASGASAAPASGQTGVAPPLIEQAQFYWNGREYCFYDDGWRGPGWYMCGYEWRRGYGWGGGREWYERRFHDGDRREYREGPRDRDHHDMDRHREPDHRDMRSGEGRRGGEGGMRGGEGGREGGREGGMR